MHLQTTHFEGFTFEGLKDENQNLHIGVRPLPPLPPKLPTTQDFTYLHTPKPLPPIPMVIRPLHRTLTLDPAVRKKKAQLLESQQVPIEVITPYLPPNGVTPCRQYYHSKTNLPMLEGDWEVDSDDESDDVWYHRMGDELMEDFDDVSAKEKILIKLWNKFIKSHTTTSDRSIPSKCKTFIASHLQQLVTDDLRQNLLLHLYNLWDSGLISSNCILSCMELYDDGVEGKNEEEDRDNEGKSSCSQTKTPKRKNIPLSIAPSSLHSSGSKRIKRG
mmetsp:Transcript_31207/g.45689  ORF Transcript_31207/g.45689 Transcript_31207/m.45689 type:complete len:274 (+) Transcript_31207:103-924(+)